jgi:hypothetical protein
MPIQPASPVFRLVIGQVRDAAFAQINADIRSLSQQKHGNSGHHDCYNCNHYEAQFELNFHIFISPCLNILASFFQAEGPKVVPCAIDRDSIINGNAWIVECVPRAVKYTPPREQSFFNRFAPLPPEGTCRGSVV